MKTGKFAFMEEELVRRARASMRRRLTDIEPVSGAEVRVHGRKLVNFSSNDYLGLSKHPLLRERALEFAGRYGSGSTASRLICGSYDAFQGVEEKLARLKGTEAALILNSGFQANVSVLPALADKNALILSDAFNHNSIIQGTVLSRCRVLRFRHNDLGHLRRLLAEHRAGGYSRILVVTESVFSVDGDQSDIRALVELAGEFNAVLMVDDAHATGVLGTGGMGLTCGEDVDLCIGTFGKGCGSFGAYVACPEVVRDYLINCCHGFIYTTALPPSVLGSIDAALDLVPRMGDVRDEIIRKADFLRASLNAMGWSTGRSTTHIVPVMTGDERRALAVSEYLERNGILATALRPPTVGEGESRIRLAVSALHTQEHLERIVHLFDAYRREAADVLSG